MTPDCNQKMHAFNQQLSNVCFPPSRNVSILHFPKTYGTRKFYVMQDIFTFCQNDTSQFWHNVSYLWLLWLLRNKQSLVLFFSYLRKLRPITHISYRMNRKFYVCSKFFRRCVLHHVSYVTLRYVWIDTYGSTVHYDTLQFLTSREGGKQA